MSGSRGSKKDNKRSTLRRVWGTPGEEKAIQVLATNGLLLAHHEERQDRICKKMPQLPSIGQLDSHSSAELTQHGHPMALPYLGASFNGTS